MARVDNWSIFEYGGYPKEVGKLLQLLNESNPPTGFRL
jgi:hypothetical protein